MIDNSPPDLIKIKCLAVFGVCGVSFTAQRHSPRPANRTWKEDPMQADWWEWEP
jgi:hypothetical protein